MKRKGHILFWLFLVSQMLRVTQCTAQDQAYRDLMRYAGNIHQFNQIYPQEKVYLQFDNTAYFQGETIWFKAFVVTAATLQRTPSKILYVDLLAADGTLLQQLKLKIVSGQADGCFVLMDSSTGQARELRGILPYSSGYYEVRAYTQFMMNFNQEATFSRVLPVFKTPIIEGDFSRAVTEQNAVNAHIRPALPKSDEINVSLYPEGGHYVKGLPCNFAFKATDRNGLGVEGTLLLTKGKQTTETHTVHNGMGSFFLEADENPTVRFRTDAGQVVKVSVPSAERRGYTMLTTYPSDTLVHVSLRRSDNADKILGVSVTCRGELIAFQAIHMNESHEAEINLPTTGWPTGVCRLVVFNVKGNILCSRSFFHGNKSFSITEIAATVPEAGVKPYEKIKLGFNLRDHSGKSFKDRFCVSVRDARDYGLIYSDNLATDLLLSSDLKGLIDDPEYYLESTDEEHRRALDLLTLVQGWERYDWKIMSRTFGFSEKRRLEDSLSLNGWIMTRKMNNNKEKFLKDINIYIAIVPREETTVELGKYTTEKIGYFGFNTKDYYGLADLTMRISPKRPEDNPPKAKIRLERALSPTPRMFERLEQMTGIPRLRRLSTRDYEETGNESVSIDEDGIMLPVVDILDKRKYIDYFTFHAYDVVKDVEAELDYGNYSTDMMGYLLDKGYTVWLGTNGIHSSGGSDELLQELSIISRGGIGSVAYHGPVKLNGSNVFWYVHNNEKCVYDGQFASPWEIDMDDVKSILVFDDPTTLYNISKEVPLYMEMLKHQIDLSSQLAMSGGTANDRMTHFILVDVLIKEDYQLRSKEEKRDLGTRITTLTGLSRERQFYSPQYPDGPIEGQPKDYRRTLYWNPNVITDSLGYAEVEFYNNSYSTHFNVSGAGITASGTPYVLDQDF